MAFLFTNETTFANTPEMLFVIGESILKKPFKYVRYGIKKENIDGSDMNKEDYLTYIANGGYNDIDETGWKWETVTGLGVRNKDWFKPFETYFPRFTEYTGEHETTNLKLYFDIDPSTKRFDIGELFIEAKFKLKTSQDWWSNRGNENTVKGFLGGIKNIKNTEIEISKIEITHWEAPENGYRPYTMSPSSVLFTSDSPKKVNQVDFIKAFESKKKSKKISNAFIRDENLGKEEQGKYKTIIGDSAGNKIKGKKSSVFLKGMGGNDKLTGSEKDDILDGGEGNDVLTGKKGADTYVLSSGKDKFKGFKLKEGDTIEIDSDISYTLVQSKKHTRIKHDDGVTTVLKMNKDDLVGVIEIV